MFKLCKKCQIYKRKTEYYKAGDYLQSSCKPCFLQNKRSTVIKGFAALPAEKQLSILDDLREYSIRKTARRNGISFGKLYRMVVKMRI